MPEKNLDQLKLQILGVKPLDLLLRVRGTRNKTRHYNAGSKAFTEHSVKLLSQRIMLPSCVYYSFLCFGYDKRNYEVEQYE